MGPHPLIAGAAPFSIFAAKHASGPALCLPFAASPSGMKQARENLY